MADVAVSYLKEEQRLVEDINGIRLTEAYVVRNLAPGRRTLYDALSASGVPNYADPHADVPNLYCVRKEPFPFARTSNTEAKVVCTFGPSDFSNTITPIIRFHGYTEEHLTNFDGAGNLIKVNYTPTGGAAYPEQVGQIRAGKAKGLLTFDYITPTDPSAMLVYLNKLNSAAWRGGGQYTWWCVDIQINKVLYRPGWGLSLAFEYDEETHIKTAAYRILGGIVPKDTANVPLPKTVTTGNGWRNALPNGFRDFNLLSLPSTF